MEDRNFYAHEGVDPRGLLRALVTNFRAKDTVAGGSTITQQLVKILFLTPERTYERKFRELGGAWTLERKLSKDQILELYLNRIYLGSGAYGVDGASRVYFNKSATELTLPEAAMLAALTRSPSIFTPRRDLAGAQARSGLVLNAMVETKAITPEEAQAARAQPATIADTAEVAARNYYFDTAAEEVKRLLPDTPGDLTVLTTFSPKMQEAARQAVESVMAKRGQGMRASQAALISMNTDGAVRALIGGRDYAETQFNRATQAKRQPGSAFKAFVYLAALEAGLSPCIDGYAPGNFDNKHYGQVTLKEALVRSLNTVAIKLQQEVGVRAVTRAAQRLGITSPLTQYASLALGTSELTPIELTSAYAAFPAGGVKVTPYSVVEVRSAMGEVLYRRSAPRQTRVIAEDKMLTMNAMLYEVVQHGTARAAILPNHEVAGKTGTSSEFRDAWFVGFTSDLVTGVWVGNDDFTPMRRVTGGSLPAQIWKSYMTVAVTDYPPKPLPKQLPEPAATLAYASYGDPLIPDQNATNGFFIEVPGFIRDLFGSSDGRDERNDRDAREQNRDRERAQDRDRGRNNDGRNRAQRDYIYPEALEPVNDLEMQRRGIQERERLQREQALERFEADRQAALARGPQAPNPFIPRDSRPEPDDMPPVDQPNPFIPPGPPPPDNFAPDPMAIPDRDVYERDLDPGYYEDEAPPPLPPPPNDPWFGWMR
jgi:penicillin-binding protein 1A